MCGIIGGYIAQPNAQPDFQVGLDKLAHRGPNDRGLEFWNFTEGFLALGHTRLSIIDLSAAGHQPMCSPCGRYAIVFNGEIYNYRELRQELKLLGQHFVSDTDTEVLLASWLTWGSACLSRLCGMFAFVVLDRECHTLTCVRDAFGIKPFFYRYGKSEFTFASEVPALLALEPQRPKLNLQRAYDYLGSGNYDDKAETFIEGVFQLLPGHMLTFDLTTAVISDNRRWWWPNIVERTDISFAEAREQLRDMFLESIRLHLRSDVLLGAALSGGLDSSAVVCAMRHVVPDMPIHTFSYVARGSDLDEEQWVDLVNNSVGAIPHKIVVSPDELMVDLDDMIRVQGEPFCSTSIYAQYRVFKLAHENGITVTLDGQGADEMLAGYRGYPGPRLHSHFERGEWIEMFKFLRAWAQWPGRSMGFGTKALIGEILPNSLRAVALRMIGRDPTPDWLNIRYFQEQGVCFDLNGCKQRSDDEVGRRLVASLRRSLTGQGLNSLLRHGDRNSMFWSVESRVPFLTTEIVEFLLSLPEHYLISRQGETKHVFREAMRGIVPDEILDRKDKIGFATPEQVWLKQLESKVFDWLAVCDELPFLNASECRAEVKSIIDGSRPFDFRAWRLINYCRWVYLFDIEISHE